MKIESISIEKLRDILSDYIERNPESKNKPIYHDALHIQGEIGDYGDFLEFW